MPVTIFGYCLTGLFSGDYSN